MILRYRGIKLCLLQVPLLKRPVFTERFERGENLHIAEFRRGRQLLLSCYSGAGIPEMELVNYLTAAVFFR